MRRLILLSLCWPLLLFAQDADRDGLADSHEQELLARFAPAFLVSSGDCDVLPATFAPGEPVPRAVARDGRIYGQVFPVSPVGLTVAFIEVHYYHLWSRDCGRTAHPLDVEHVSVLLRAPDPDAVAKEWQAVYWYASAHQNTICDASQGATAAALHAEETGATVWISAGKHASFLSPEACRGGCGGDRCEPVIPMGRTEVVNLGERAAPLNGAVWSASRTWPLEAKMTTDFPGPVLGRLQQSTAVVILNPRLQPAQAAVAASGSGFDAAHGSVDRSLRRAFRAILDQVPRVP